MGLGKSLLVTIPVFNEAKRIGPAIAALLPVLESSPFDFKLVVAEDGSTDNSKEVLRELQSIYPKLIVESDSVRRGRGFALSKTWRRHPADFYCYVDADLPAGALAVARVVETLRDGADVATGSRYCKNASVQRPPLVHFVSRCYNLGVRVLFHDRIMDHQCGLKAFSRTAFAKIQEFQPEDSWFWDTQALVLSVRSGLKVVEVPLDWVERRYSRTSLARLAREIPYFSIRLIRLLAAVKRGNGVTRELPTVPVLVDK